MSLKKQIKKSLITRNFLIAQADFASFFIYLFIFGFFV